MIRRSAQAALLFLGAVLFAGDGAPVVVRRGPELFLADGDADIGARVALDGGGAFMGLHFNVFDGFVDARGGTLEGLEPPFSFGGGARGASVSAAGDGEFAVVWSQMPEVGAYADVRLQRYQVDGTPIGSEVPVSEVPTQAIAARTAVATRSSSFLVVWEDWQPGAASDVRGRVVPFDGPPAASFQINEWTTGSQTEPRLAVRADGSGLAVWAASNCSPADTSGCIRGRLLAPSGLPSGPDVAINSVTTGLQTSPAVATDGDRFVVVWRSDDCDGGCIRGRLVDAAGSPILGDFRVDQSDEGFQRSPGVGAAGFGGFVVSWKRQIASVARAYARAFDAAAEPLTDEFQVNATSTDVYETDLAMSAGGDFIVVWSNNYELWGQRFELNEPVFEDGFESGDTSGWSATVP